MSFVIIIKAACMQWRPVLACRAFFDVWFGKWHVAVRAVLLCVTAAAQLDYWTTKARQPWCEVVVVVASSLAKGTVGQGSSNPRIDMDTVTGYGPYSSQPRHQANRRQLGPCIYMI